MNLVGFFRLKSKLRLKNHIYTKNLQMFSTGTNSHQTEQRLAGKITLITGAASGIGKAPVTEFIQYRAKVVLTDINVQLGKSTAEKLGPNASFITYDVTQESQFALAIDTVVDKHGCLDILHNNTGIAECLARSITSLNVSDFDHTMAVNVRSVVTGIKHSARVMIPQRSGNIICIGSVTGILGGMAPHDYSILKAAVIGAVRSATAELSKYGIRVNCISPHAIATPLGVDAMKKLPPELEEDTIVHILNWGA